MLAGVHRVSLGAALILAVIGVSACAGFAAKGEAESAVANFHLMLDAEKYADIYQAADDAFKNATTEGQLHRRSPGGPPEARRRALGRAAGFLLTGPGGHQPRQ